MLGRFTAASGSYAASILALAGAARAQPPAPAPATAAEPAVLWYRSTGECPDGAGFLTRVGDRAASVRLAEAGDRVDFVVNLSMTPGGARGRLERETDGGTVAIREVVDASCERAADVIALNLALALDPERPGGEPVAGPAPSPVQNASEPVEAKQETEASVPRPRSTPPPVKAQMQSVPEAAPAEPGPDRWRVGAQGGLLGGLSPELMARGTAFVELRDALPPPLAGATFRVAAVGAFGSSDTDSGAVDQSLWAARLDVCLLSLGGPIVSLRPCAAGELGQLKASHAQSASALWAAVDVHARGHWVLGSSVAIEAEVAAVFPLSRYEVSAGSTVLYRSAPAGLAAAIGASIGF